MKIIKGVDMNGKEFEIHIQNQSWSKVQDGVIESIYIPVEGQNLEYWIEYAKDWYIRMGATFDENN